MLDLAADGYVLRACAEVPLSEKIAVQLVDPAEGLLGAVKALSEKEAFGQLNALYVRKSSAEENLQK